VGSVVYQNKEVMVLKEAVQELASALSQIRGGLLAAKHLGIGYAGLDRKASTKCRVATDFLLVMAFVPF
jgi:hypothetical protein